MMRDLEQLVSQAQGLAGDHPCATFGHEWEPIGGRACPHAHPDSSFSQTVFVCSRCGDIDYGAPGGPGYAECRDECREEDCRRPT